eukprot:1060610-Amphidinium_carterae.1
MSNHHSPKQRDGFDHQCGGCVKLNDGPLMRGGAARLSLKATTSSPAAGQGTRASPRLNSPLSTRGVWMDVGWLTFFTVQHPPQ